MPRPFTGWHMTAILVAFFGTVIAINFVMARAAIRTFGGTVVDNSYVASQQFNSWLAEARSERRLAWHASSSIGPDRSLRIAIAPPGGGSGYEANAIARHPLGSAPDFAIALRPTAEGGFVSAAPLPAGRWQIQIEVRKGAEHERALVSVR